MTYAEKQKAQTLSTVPEIDTEVFSKKLLDAKLNYEKEIYHPVTQKVEPDTDRNSILTNDYTRFTEDLERQLKPVKVTFKPTVADLPTNPLEEFINDALANGFTYENGVLTKHTTDDPYPFLKEIADLITVCKTMPIDPWKVAELCCQALENSIINEYKGEE